MGFNHYAYRSSAHKPNDQHLLKDIYLMHLSDIPSRLLRFLLKIEAYDFVIKSVPVIMIPMANAFSISAKKSRMKSKV